LEILFSLWFGASSKAILNSKSCVSKPTTADWQNRRKNDKNGDKYS